MLKLLNAKCYSCKDYSHLPEDCPKDPNLRSLWPEPEEMIRIKDILKLKQRGVNEANEWAKMMDMLEGKVGETAFAGYEVLRQGTLDMCELFGEVSPFMDIRQYKRDTAFNECANKIVIEEFSTRELHQE